MFFSLGNWGLLRHCEHARFRGKTVKSCSATSASSRAQNEATVVDISRAGEMIPEVEGTRPWGPSMKRDPECIKGPKTTYTTIAVAEKQSKRSKKGPFSLYIRSPPPVPPRRWNYWGPEGKVPPGPPRFLQPWISRSILHGLSSGPVTTRTLSDTGCHSERTNCR